MTHICVSKLGHHSFRNGLSPDRRHPLSEPMLKYYWLDHGKQILIKIQQFSFNKIHLKMSSTKWRPFCLSLNVLQSCCFPWGSMSAASTIRIGKQMENASLCRVPRTHPSYHPWWVKLGLIDHFKILLELCMLLVQTLSKWVTEQVPGNV